MITFKDLKEEDVCLFETDYSESTCIVKILFIGSNGIFFQIISAQDRIKRVLEGDQVDDDWPERCDLNSIRSYYPNMEKIIDWKKENKDIEWYYMRDVPHNNIKIKQILSTSNG